MFKFCPNLHFAIVSFGCLVSLVPAQTAEPAPCDTSKMYRHDSSDPAELYCAAMGLESQQNNKDAGKLYLRTFQLAFETVDKRISERLDIRITGLKSPFMDFLKNLRPTMELGVSAARTLMRLKLAEKNLSDIKHKTNSLISLMSIASEPVFAYDELESQLSVSKKPFASYTDAARNKNVQGSVVLVVIFGADGNVKQVLPLTTLPSGLTDQAIQAAKKIKFEPGKKNGTPVSVINKVEYSFTIF